MTSVNFSKIQIKNYLINRSLLQKKAVDIDEVMNLYTCLQVDPINVVAKNHELILYNRVKDFKFTDLDKYIYEKRKAFEYWLQLYSIISIQAYPYIASRMNIKSSWHESYYKLHKKEIDMALNFIEDNGPTSSKDLLHIPKVKALFSWKENDSRTALLNYLWDTGKIMISHRSKNLKFYDLTEKLVQKEYIHKRISKEKSLEYILLSYFKYFGIVQLNQLVRSGSSIRNDLKKILKEKLISGDILNITIDNQKSPYYINKNQIKDIVDLGMNNSHYGISILPPLDPIVLNRRVLKDIFNFDYTWEAYVPSVKRKFDFYGMPVLFNAEFIGQVALQKDKNQFMLKKQDFKSNTYNLKKSLKIEIEEMSKSLS